MNDLWWLLKRFWWLVLIVVVPAGLGLWCESTRLDMAMTIWSSSVLGAFVWVILGWHGDPVLRRFWLRRNAPYVTPHLKSMLTGASLVLKDILNASTDALVDGETLSIRRKASQGIRESFRAGNTGPGALDTGSLEWGIRYLDKYYAFTIAQGGHTVLSSLADLQACLHRFGGACRSVLQIRESVPGNLRTAIPILLEATLDLCDTCSTISMETGVLEKG